MTRKEAIKCGAMFYTGRVCSRHPGLAGQKRTKSNACPDCQRERVQKRRKKMGRKEYNRRRRERNRERRAAIKAGTWSPRSYRRANEVVT